MILCVGSEVRKRGERGEKEGGGRERRRGREKRGERERETNRQAEQIR